MKRRFEYKGNVKYTGGWKPPYFIGVIKKRFKETIKQAAEETGFSIYVAESATHTTSGDVVGESEDKIVVFTRDGVKDHTPFWDRYRELKKEME